MVSSNHLESLSGLANDLNQASDDVQKLIVSLNEKLSALNLGIECWLTRPGSRLEGSAPWAVRKSHPEIPEVEVSTPIQRYRAFEIGYAKVNGKWQLAARECVFETGHVEFDPEETYNCIHDLVRMMALMEAPREVRIGSANLVDDLLLEMKQKAESYLRSAEKAKQRYSPQ